MRLEIHGLAVRKAGPVDNIEVQPTVIVKIAPGGRLALGGITHACLRRDIDEALPRQIAHEGVGLLVQDVQVQPTVVVIVRPHGPAAHLFRQRQLVGPRGLGEAAVLLVAVQHVGRQVAGHEQVDPTVVVIVAPSLSHAQIALYPVHGELASVDRLDSRTAGGVHKSTGGRAVDNAKLRLRHRRNHAGRQCQQGDSTCQQMQETFHAVCPSFGSWGRYMRGCAGTEPS